MPGKKLILPLVAVAGVAVVILALPFTGLTQPVAPLRSFYGLEMWLDKPTRSGTNPYGEFKLQYRPFGLDSRGHGGACLIADIAALIPAGNPHKVAGEIHEGTCTKPEHCNLKGSPPPPGVWEGYCVPDGPKPEGRCWYRPSDNDLDKKKLCHTSGHNKGLPWPVGANQIAPYAQTVNDTPRFDMQAFYQAHTNGTPAQWRLSGRLFGTLGGVRSNFGHPACLSPDKKKKCTK
jgi:hypothetical protein